ncbi:MAG TPA: M42 family peptidase, partial [Opitutaceae bacterium]|nr:M42 family peptidase [Opitutaceae bacterium]
MDVPPFLIDLLTARSPSGAETESQAVWDRHVQPAADEYRNDALGNRLATLNPGGNPTLMLAGHMDELGLMVIYVNKDGFLYFDTVGGHDRTVISGRRVIIQTAHGPVKGVTGKRAVHLMDEADRKKVPEIHEIWIDIGAASKKEALERVAIGDVATYDHNFELFHGSLGVARAFDDKVGAYIVGETLIRLAAQKKKLAAKVVSVATVQEEIGTRGAATSAYLADPHIAVAVDVSH